MVRQGVHMKADRKRPLNIIEIAKLAGSSKSAVSRVIRNQSGVRPEIRARIQHVIRVHHYQPSVFGRGLTGAQTGLIGVLGRWMGSGFTAEVIRGINDEVQKRGGHTLVTFAPGIEEYIAVWRSFVEGRQVDGVVLLAPPVDVFQQEVSPFDRPMVLCACKPANRRKGWDRVGAVALDNQKPMERLVQHLVLNGYRRLVHLCGPPDNFDSQERIRFFKESVAQHPGVTGSLVQGAWTTELARSVVREYLATHVKMPDAFLAFNDQAALATLEVLRARGVRVPEEVAVTGWDDTEFSGFAGLTTVRLPMVEIGWEAARILYELIDAKPGAHGRQVVLETPLEARETSGDGHRAAT